MKYLLVIVALIICCSCLADEPHKLWVHSEYNQNSNEVLFIQDLETGTRCYAITNSKINASGYAISCVPKSR